MKESCSPNKQFFTCMIIRQLTARRALTLYEVYGISALRAVSRRIMTFNRTFWHFKGVILNYFKCGFTINPLWPKPADMLALVYGKCMFWQNQSVFNRLIQLACDSSRFNSFHLKSFNTMQK